MTGVPARVFGLEGRGRIEPGYHADIVLFDADNVIDRATYSDPIRPADGIVQVLVAGKTVWRDGTAAGARPGRVIRRGAAA